MALRMLGSAGRAATVVAVTLAVPVLLSVPDAARSAPDGFGDVITNTPRAIEAAATSETYRPGDVAAVRLFDDVRDARLGVYRIGQERIRWHRNDMLFGVPVRDLGTRRVLRTGQRISFRVGDWPSGLYFVRLAAPGGRIGFSPFVVAPRRLGEHRVAIVLPTNTWQAYNFRDANGDGTGDSWYDVIAGYRDRGGNLAFLSANNLYWRVDRRPGVLVRVAKWRDLGRPEAGVVGVQFAKNDDGSHRGPWLVRASRYRAWLFRSLAPGARFSNGGIEVDMFSPASPPGTTILAEIPNLFAPGLGAQMAYYETPAGAKVFAAGAFSLGGSALQPSVSALLGRLWARLSRP